MSQQQVTFGLFDWIDADGVREPGQLYRERLDLLAEAEAQGFDIYHLAEHHGTPLGLAPSPNVFLAAAAARTTRIRLSALVYVLPLYDPARLAEEIAMLDQLSDGRLEAGFGKGGNPYELLPYGIGADEAQQRYDEVFAAVLARWRPTAGSRSGRGSGPGRRCGTRAATRRASRGSASAGSTRSSASASGRRRWPRPGCGGTSTSPAWRPRRPGRRWAGRERPRRASA